MDMSPFDHAFMRHALLAGVFAGISCGLVGVFAVLMRLTFIGVCLAHAAFAGGLAALLFGLDPLLGALVLSVGAAAVIGPLADKGEVSPDTAVGVVFTAMLGVAILCLGIMPGPKSAGLNLLWGSILTASKRDVWLLGGVSFVVVGGIILFYKEILAVTCHRHVAALAGIPATAIFYAILFATGMTVTACLPSVGGLLVYSLIINPAAAAYQLTYRLSWMFVFAAALGAVSCTMGLFLAWYADVPAGAAIVVSSSLIFLVCSFFSPKNRSQSGKAHAPR
ncbi:metal ABC transporter permease [Fundidesulfovibrio putealis]|uniref:metal ABC transporter permease n=1 Tax=Fundidesulfovibrio putealis TaxID=270496 RepID=UPI0003FFF9BC|nr:metal ABC transporter permease [Fundidesulfovibrio putealis]